MRTVYAVYCIIILLANNFILAVDQSLPSCYPEGFYSEKWSSISNEIKELIQEGFYQEAIWKLDEKGYKSQKDDLVQILENIMTCSEIVLDSEDPSPKKGVTKPQFVDLKCGVRGLLKIKKNHPSSNYKAEVAAYRIDKLLGFYLVPVTVLRINKGSKASLQYLLKEVNAPGVDYKKSTKLLLFDYIISNKDRNIENVLIYKNREVAIDHGLSLKRKNILGYILGRSDKIKNSLGLKVDPIRSVNLDLENRSKYLGAYQKIEKTLKKTTKDSLKNILEDIFSEKKINYILKKIKRILV